MKMINTIYRWLAIVYFALLLFSCTTSHQRLIFGKAEMIARVTGKSANSEDFPNPNATHTDYNVGGTDLGIIWEIEKGQYGIFFGDTYGRYHLEEPIEKGADWRCNVLAYSDDKNLEDGLTLNNMAVDSIGNAREIVYGGKDTSGHGNWTSIPTGAIRANRIDYVHYMNVCHWNSSNWGTNYSGLYKSSDNGKTWNGCPSVKFGKDSNFGQVGYWKKDGYVYMIGTESGRQSTARLCRFLEQDIEKQDKYEFWNGKQNEWIIGDEMQATNLFEDHVGELSFIYHNKSKSWILAYFCETRNEISIRYSKDLVGVWSEPLCVASRKEFPRLYGSYIHPVSTDKDCLYFLMSMWEPYNVFLMKTEIKY